MVLHALADALLGAVAAGDIGTHFPDTDPSLRGADSAVLLRQVVALVQARGHSIENVDVTVLAERPKLGPHFDRMRRRLADLLGVAVDKVSLKAKSTEGLGAVGRGDAIAALAVALVS